MALDDELAAWLLGNWIRSGGTCNQGQRYKFDELATLYFGLGSIYPHPKVNRTVPDFKIFGLAVHAILSFLVSFLFFLNLFLGISSLLSGCQ